MDRILVDIGSGFYIIPTMPETMIVGQGYYIPLLVHGAVGKVSFQIVDGQLPDGMHLEGSTQPIAPTAVPEDGTIQGAPTEVYMIGHDGVDARAHFTIRATDRAGRIADLVVNQRVVWAQTPSIVRHVGSDSVVFALLGGPAGSGGLDRAYFSPPLPSAWVETPFNGGRNINVDHSAGGLWQGDIYWDLPIANGASYYRAARRFTIGYDLS